MLAGRRVVRDVKGTEITPRPQTQTERQLGDGGSSDEMAESHDRIVMRGTLKRELRRERKSSETRP